MTTATAAFTFTTTAQVIAALPALRAAYKAALAAPEAPTTATTEAALVKAARILWDAPKPTKANDKTAEGLHEAAQRLADVRHQRADAAYFAANPTPAAEAKEAPECLRCGDTGFLPHFRHVAGGACFDCN